MKKFSNKKGITISLIALAAVALGTVGFATWIITATSVDTVSTEVSLTIGDVKEESLTLTLSETTETLVFDGDSSGTSSSIKGNSTQELTFDFELTVELTNTSRSLSDVISDITVEIKDCETATTGVYFSNIADGKHLISPYQVGKAENLISGDNIATNNYSYSVNYSNGSYGGIKTSYSVNYDSDNKKSVISGTLGFSWGSYYDYLNPTYTTRTNDDLEELITNLKAFSIAMKGVSSITVEFGVV